MRNRSWRLTALSSVVALTLAACSDQPATTPENDSPKSSESQTGAVSERSTMPPRVEIAVEHVILEQTGLFAGNAPDVHEGSLTIEFLEGTAEELTKALTDDLRSQDFRLSQSEAAKGGQRLTFRRNEGERVSVLIRPEDEVKLETEGAKGSIYLSWRSR